MTRTLTLREYELAECHYEDFVISTARVMKIKPVVMTPRSPTDYQLEIDKLVLVDRTRPWMLEKYFDAAHFSHYRQTCRPANAVPRAVNSLKQRFCWRGSFWIRLLSVKPSSAPCSATASRAASLNLLAQNGGHTTPCWRPHGVQWATSRHVIFLLATSAKSEYEEVMAI